MNKIELNRVPFSFLKQKNLHNQSKAIVKKRWKLYSLKRYKAWSDLYVLQFDLQLDTNF